MIHWSQNKTHLVVYHGTHTRNIPHILKNGLSNKDPKTGMVSVTFGSHGKSVAHGYAAMSGEHNFRQAGAKAETVPDEHRSIVVAHLPMEWVKANVDTNFGGNSPEIKSRLQNKEAHEQFVAKHGTDFLPHETPEFRFKEAIPPEFIVGVEKKKTKYVTGESKEQPMKTFKEFVEIVAEEVPTVSTDGVAKFDPLLSSVQRRTNILDVIRKFLHNAKLRPLATDRNPNSQNDEMARNARTTGDGSVGGT